MNLAFFASHRGSNMQAVLDAWSAGKLDVSPRLLISNNRKAEALVRAKSAGLATAVRNGVTHPDPDDLDKAILDLLLEHDIELIVLAGYMKLLGPKVVARFRNRILNIHPALLPKFGGSGMYGIRVHEAVIAAGETETGVTVHHVDERYDEGEIVAQTRVDVLPSDTPETLAARVLDREHGFLVEVMDGIASKRILLAMIEIAHATPDDCRHIAEIQVRGWQAAYRGIIPDDFLDRLDPTNRVGVWRMFVESRKGTMLISRRGTTLCGFCHLIPSRDDDGEGIAEIAAIYIDPNHWRHGYGRLLCDKAFTLAAQQEFKSLTLWVLTENARGRAFYEAMGMQPDGATKEVERPGFTLKEMRYRIDLPPPHPPRRAI